MNTMPRSKPLSRFEMKRLRPLALVGVLMSLAASASAAGQVDVSFVNASTYADAGFSQAQRAANLKVLGDYLTQVGSAALAPGQTLKVEVLDVTLAGTDKHSIANSDLRIVRGGADWPRMTLRYSLEADGKVLQSGQESIADLDYLNRGLSASLTESGPLPYEKRMLSAWVKSRFGGTAAVKG